MSGWDEYGEALTEFLRTARPGTLLVLQTPGRRHLEIQVCHDRVSAILTDTQRSSDLWRLTEADDAALRRLGWHPVPPNYGVVLDDPHDELAGFGTKLVETLRTVFLIGAPGEVEPSARIDAGPPLDVSVLRRPLPPAVELDTSGWRRRSRRSPFWTDDETGGCTELQSFLRPPPEPYWLEDLDAARAKLARDHARAGCLISADPVAVGPLTGLALLYKARRPNGSDGITYGVLLWLAKATRAVCVHHIVAAPALTDTREAAVLAELGSSLRPQPHPYAPDLTSALPYSPADAESWDATFPDHPLTRTRAWLRAIPTRLKIDPAFAASPDFTGTAARTARESAPAG